MGLSFIAHESLRDGMADTAAHAGYPVIPGTSQPLFVMHRSFSPRLYRSVQVCVTRRRTRWASRVLQLGKREERSTHGDSSMSAPTAAITCPCTTQVRIR